MPCNNEEREWLLARLSVAMRSAVDEMPDDFLTYAHFVRCVGKLDWNSTPGYPYALQFASNAQLFHVVDGVPDDQAMEMVFQMVKEQIAARRSDPIRIFVKQEPHKSKKLSDFRPRLISSVSVVDQLIDHMLFDEYNSSMVEHYVDVPAKVGWAPVCGGWKYVPQGKVMAIDKTAWDWTVQPWIVDIILEHRLRKRKNATEEWRDLVRWRYKALYVDPTFIFSNGLLLKQCFVGWLKSGCVNTIADNSMMQYVIHCRVSQDIGIPIDPYVWAMGDDTLQYMVPKFREYLDKMEKYCIVKECQRRSEFAGMDFRGMIVDPMYTAKHAYKLLHIDDKVKEDVVRAYALLYHRSAKKHLIYPALRELGDLPSEEELDHIYDGRA